MRAPDAFLALQARARRRAAAIGAWRVLPWLLPAAWWAHQARGAAWLLPVAVALVAAWATWRAAMRIDAAWIARGLDASRVELEDSSALLLADPATLPPLARLQRARIAGRLGTDRDSALRPAWPRALAAPALAAIACTVVLALAPWRALPSPPRAGAAPALRGAATGAQGLRTIELRVTPPAYTGLPASRGDSQEVLVPEGSVLQWRLVTRHAARSVSLDFHDGSTLALQRDGDGWRGTRRVLRDSLYRLRYDARTDPAARWHRISVRRDRPPRLQVRLPEHSLTVLDRAQTGWDLLVEASDDYGLGAASLQVTLAQGSGEDIKVSTRTLALADSGDARARRYRRRVDLGALGFAVGDDLVLRVSVADRRAPLAQVTRSPGFILRWPPPPGAQASGVEGLVKRTLPAYFRSQRQIIIDTEALLGERRGLAAATVDTRSDGIGVDQRILRLRYGQFLGEESESGRPAATPDAVSRARAVTADAPAAPNASAPAADAGAAPAAPADSTLPAAGEAGDTQVAAAPATGFGVDTAGVVAEFSHIHDAPEAATLLDPDTRLLLKSALDAMWLAEGELRTSHPERALPHEYRALRFIKQVQQASRIYLARVGLELPPVDETRRLHGDRAGIAPSADDLRPAETTAAPVRDLWLQLGALPAAAAPGTDDAAREQAAQAFARWLRARDARTAAGAADGVADGTGTTGAEDDTLALFEAFDRWHAQPGCAACTEALRRRLWPLLPPVTSALRPRAAADAGGARYLDALQAPRP
jgi:hypothetical protein